MVKKGFLYACYLVKNILYVFFAYQITKLTDLLIQGRINIFYQNTLMTAVILFLYCLAATLSAVLLNSISNADSVQIRMDIFRDFFQRTTREWEDTEKGEDSAFFINDIDMFEKSDIRVRYRIFDLISSILITIFAIYRMNPTFVLIAIMIMLLTAILPIVFAKKIQAYNNGFLNQNQYFYGKTEEYLGRYPLIREYGLEQKITNKMQSIVGNRQNAKRDLENILTISGQMINLLGFVMILGIYVLAGRLIDRNVIEVGSIIGVTQLTNNLIVPISQIMESLNDYYSIKEIRDRVKGTRSKLKIKVLSPAYKSIRNIQIKNLSYLIPNTERELFHDLNLEFQDNHSYAICGKNGCGKSTLLKLIAGKLQTGAGKILYNGSNRLSEDEIIQQITYIPQHISLFDFDETVEENATLFETFSANQVKEYSQKMGIPKKWFEESKKCSMLSGGEKQKIAIMQSILSQKRIILWDESDSSLDSDSKKQIYKMLQTLKNKIIIIVTHDYTSLNYFDYVIDLEDKV
jgi:ATP-binding cassette subfamily B protein